jgi:hypothetical protein
MPSAHLRPALLAVALACGLAHAAPAADEPMLAYTVSPHDTLIGLNRTLFASPRAWPEVARLNRLADPNRISPGQVLMVPTRLLQSKPVAATLVVAFGDVRIGGRTAPAGAKIEVGDTVTTAEASTAVVQLADGSRIRLAPATEGRLDEHRRFRIRPTRAAIDDGLLAGTLRLLHGSIEVFATKVLRARPLEVSTPTAVIGVRGTVYRVRADGAPADASVTEVLEGRVHAQAGTAPAQGADVPAGFGAALQAGKAPVVVPLLPAPDLSGMPARFDRLPLRLRVPGNTPLRVQVASDADFDRIVVDLHVAAGDEIRIPELADGPWHLRARRIGPEGLEGLDAVHAFELRARPEAPFLVEPVGGAKRMVGDVTLRWTENPEAASYRVEVARDADFTQVAMRADGLHGASTVFHPEGTAFGAADGVYFWRVESVRADGSAGPVGESQAFVLRPVPRAPLGDMSPDGTAVELMWGGRPEDRVQVELARDPAFREIVDRGEFAAPRGRLARPTPGVVYARYRFIEPDGFRTDWSDSVKIEVDRSWRKALRALFEGPGK